MLLCDEVCVLVCVCACLCVHVCVYVLFSMCVRACVRACVRVCTSLCMCALTRLKTLNNYRFLVLYACTHQALCLRLEKEIDHLEGERLRLLRALRARYDW